MPLGADATPARLEERSPVETLLLACCGLKGLVLASIALWAGSVGIAVRNAVTVAGLAAAIALTLWCSALGTVAARTTKCRPRGPQRSAAP